MWQNDIEKNLLNVAGCKGLKYYLPEVKNLQVAKLGCDENSILFREEYSFALEKLKDRRSNHRIGGMGRVVLGHPGIGTSLL
jgi:hypothetical protein